MTRMLLVHVLSGVAILHAVNAKRSERESGLHQDLQSNNLQQQQRPETWKACKLMGFTTYKQYHFQFMVDDNPVAVLLERYKYSPEIKIWSESAWKLNLYQSELEWKHALPNFGTESHVMPKTIPLINASYVRYEPGSEKEGTPSLIMIGQQSGDPLILSGGSYLNDELMKLALLSHSKQNRQEGVVAGEDRLINAPAQAGAKRAAGKVLSHGKFWAESGAVVGGLSAASLAALPLAFVGSTPGALASAMITGAAQGGAVLGAAGAAFGVATGLVTGVVAGAAKYRKLKREASLGMPEKIFEKLRCHWQFKICTPSILVRKGAPCPLEAPGSEFLVKFYPSEFQSS